MAKVVWTQEAERWLLKIHDYIARDKPGAAFNVVKSIYARAQVLEQFPRSGQSYRSKSGREARILMWGHYRIVYIQPTESEVHIVGVFHGAMELDRYLKWDDAAEQPDAADGALRGRLAPPPQLIRGCSADGSRAAEGI